MDTYHRPKTHGRPEEKLVEFEAGVEGCFAGSLNFFILNLEIDGAVFFKGRRREVFGLEVLVHFGSVLVDLSS